MKSVVVTIFAATLLFNLAGENLKADELDLNDCIELALKNRVLKKSLSGME